MKLHKSNNQVTQSPFGKIVRTQIRAGNAASDRCYFDRNLRTLECVKDNWNNIISWCRGTNNEGMLKKCLSNSGELNWWRDFNGCTDAAQCLTLSPVDTD